jgi:hypothetical protein
LWVIAWETCLQNLGQLEDHNKLSYGGLEDLAQQATIFGASKVLKPWMD